MNIQELAQIIEIQDQEDAELAAQNNPDNETQLEPEGLEDEKPLESIEPEEPVSIEQIVNLIVVTTFNDENTEETIKDINALLKRKKIASAVYAMENVTEVGKEELEKEAPQTLPPVEPEEYEPVEDLNLDVA